MEYIRISFLVIFSFFQKNWKKKLKACNRTEEYHSCCVSAFPIQYDPLFVSKISEIMIKLLKFLGKHWTYFSG